MLLVFVVLCLALIYLGFSYIVGNFFRWRRSYSLSWPKTLPSVQQAAICKRFFARHGVKSKYPMLIGMKYHLEIWQGRHCVLVSFGGPGFPQTKVLFQDLSEFRQLKFPRGNCTTVVFFPEIINTRAFEWSREFLVPILYPAQMGTLLTLMQSQSEDLTNALFKVSADSVVPRHWKDVPATETLFDDLTKS